MKKALVTIITFFIMTTVYSQSSIYIGAKSYDCTNTWSFLNAKKYHAYEYMGATDVSVAKTKSGGLLIISLNTNFSQDIIGGPIMIYLTNGKIITPTTRYSKDFSDETSTSTYILTSSQINQLKNANISKIRYSLYSNFGNYKTNSITAENRINKTYEINVYDEGSNDTMNDINDLFGY